MKDCEIVESSEWLSGFGPDLSESCCCATRFEHCFSVMAENEILLKDLLSDQGNGNRRSGILLSGTRFASWKLAGEQLKRLQTNAKAGSVCRRVIKVPRPQIAPDAFGLECGKCGASCQLGNLSKRHTKDH